ncbi:GspE/PulE family protein [Verrucomicrobiales bacterium]|nr:GspE/PulE family protein [bacterium]MDB4662123.1 GspE/PulE family protein [Verrucomicrobiales bacterium]MDC0276225.1 GspE/PulE family protein [Verrucomicrobiales bacterium]MDC0321793.1 GspE/PulE family protein [Verrucomicrobiales bacterium]
MSTLTQEPPTQPQPASQVPNAAAPAPEQSPASMTAGFSDAVGGLMSMEGNAIQFGLLPVKLPREHCSVDAEIVLRKLGRFPQTDTPWLPISTLGPFLIFGHHSPKPDDMWGVPGCFAIRIAISSQQYETIKKDLLMRLSTSPLPQEGQFESLTPPQFGKADHDIALKWLLEAYPYDNKEKERLTMLSGEVAEKQGYIDVEGLNGIQPNLGVAVDYLIQGPSLLCYNPEEAPRQERFPAPLLEKHNVYPVYMGEHKIYLLTANESDYAFEDEWLSQGNDPVEFIPVLADRKLIKGAISRSGISLNAQAGVSIEEDTLSLSNNANLVEIEPEDMAEINPQNVNHTPEEMMHWVLYTAVTNRASDLHIEKFYNVARFRARIDGQMRTIYTAPEELMLRFISLIKNYSNMSQSRQEALDGRFAMAIGKRMVDVRVAAVPCRRDKQKIIMRFLDKQDGLKELSDLNLARRQSSIIKRTMARDQGLVLITGPTGSGKTTTLYALINSINEEGINIHTCEDPIEYEIEGINQTQIDPTHKLTFGNALRALLRSDPDVILIGECRDAETANAAVNAALTGHLVLTTLHANDSLRAVSRLLSMDVEPHLVGDSLAMTQAQRLMRRLCSYCKRPVEPTPDIVQIMQRQGIQPKSANDPIYVAVGCPECSGTGYRGRVALMEMCEVNGEIADMVERQASQTELRNAALKTGFQTLYQEGLNQVLEGHTTMDEIKKVSYTAR